MWVCVCGSASKYSETEHRLLEARGVFFSGQPEQSWHPSNRFSPPAFLLSSPPAPILTSFCQLFTAIFGGKRQQIRRGHIRSQEINYEMKSVLNSLASNDSASIEGDFEDLGRLVAPLLRRSRRSPLFTWRSSPPLLLQLTSWELLAPLPPCTTAPPPIQPPPPTPPVLYWRENLVIVAGKYVFAKSELAQELRILTETNKYIHINHDLWSEHWLKSWSKFFQG